MADSETTEAGLVAWTVDHGRRVASVWLGVGGAWGIVSAVWVASSSELGTNAHASVRLPVMALILFGACIAAGVLLWLDATAGDVLAPLVLTSQLVSFSFGDVEYLFSLGAGLFVGIDDSALALTGRLGSRFIAAVGEASQSFTLFLNVVPIVLLALILRTPGRGRASA